VTETLSKQPCLCDQEADDRTCKPTTRLSVMLPELEAIGVWRMESHGWNAAAEIPNMHDLAAYLGELVPAKLLLADRRTVSDGRTNRFVVPVLDLEVSAARLTAIAQQANGAQAAAAIGGGPPAIGAAPPDYTDAIAACTSKEDVTALWHRIGQAGHLDEPMKDRLMARAEELVVVEGTVMPDAGDVNAAWAAMVAAVGVEGWDDSQMRRALEDRFAQPVEDLTAGQLDVFVAELRDGKISVPA
jgi:hypothetical protein